MRKQLHKILNKSGNTTFNADQSQIDSSIHKIDKWYFISAILSFVRQDGLFGIRYDVVFSIPTSHNRVSIDCFRP